MKILFTTDAWDDFSYWLENDRNQIKKIIALVDSIQSTPFKGIGKPEALRHQLKGFWSRRINHEHRLVYQISGNKKEGQTCTIIQCRFHYT